MLSKSQKHNILSCGPLSPNFNEDLVDALLDNPWITTNDLDWEVEEEVPDAVVRKSSTFTICKEQVVAWRRHDSTGLPAFWDK